MHLAEAGGSRSRDVATRVAHLRGALKVAEHVCDLRVDVEPVALVLRLLLDPLHSGVLVLGELGRDLLEGERTELLYTDDSDIIALFLLASRIDIVVDLAGAKDDFLYLFCRHEVLVLISVDFLEAVVRSELLDVGVSLRKLEQLLGSCNNKGLAEGSSHLASK